MYQTNKTIYYSDQQMHNI